MSNSVEPIPRRIERVVLDDLHEKMVLLSGPRQCGKTTVARRAIDAIGGAYFNHDVALHRARLRRLELPEAEKLWVFDELHKLRGWRNWLKGVYDLHHEHHAILVTGSARLDVQRRSGDSLQGRFFPARLHPFTLSEVCGVRVPDDPDRIVTMSLRVPASASATLADLLRLGGFPEPFLAGSDRRAARWRLAYGALLVREEARDVESMRDLDRLEQLFERLPDVVGSPLSINALREDLEVAFETVASWIAALERLYAVFRIPPWGPPRVRAVKKSQKLYAWDWARVGDRAASFENLVAVHLLRFVHWLEDVHGEKVELRFARDVVGHEVDFVLMRQRRPWMAIEVKSDDRPLDAGLRYFLERAKVPHAFQIALDGKLDRRIPNVGASTVRLMPAAQFLAQLP